MNNCQFVGRLTADPELRRTQEGTAVCSYSLAVKRPMTKDATDFLDFVTWRQGAEYLTQYAIRAISWPFPERCKPETGLTRTGTSAGRLRW